MPVKILLVDDSAVIRGLIAQNLSTDPDLIIAGRAHNGESAIKMASELQPDVIILDIEMPVMDGMTALPKILAISPRSKIIMASTLTERNAKISLQALALGAADYLAKPTARSGNEVEDFYLELNRKVRALGGLQPISSAIIQKPVAEQPPPLQKIAPSEPVPRVEPLIPGLRLNPAGIAALAIASSTGGPQALLSVFEQCKGYIKNIPIFITQHMPPTFTTIMAEQLAKTGDRPCSEATGGLQVQPGHAYVAPGNFHMTAEKEANGHVVLKIDQKPPENFCRPAADPMLRSLSRVYGNRLAVVVLTGMGQDGMEGAKEVVRQGGSVIAQDEASCVVYGMPKAVVEQGLCRAVLPLAEIGPFLVRQTERMP